MRAIRREIKGKWTFECPDCFWVIYIEPNTVGLPCIGETYRTKCPRCKDIKDFVHGRNVEVQ
jgi:hypothetical protein